MPRSARRSCAVIGLGLRMRARAGVATLGDREPRHPSGPALEGRSEPGPLRARHHGQRTRSSKPRSLWSLNTASVIPKPARAHRLTGHPPARHFGVQPKLRHACHCPGINGGRQPTRGRTGPQFDSDKHGWLAMCNYLRATGIEPSGHRPTISRSRGSPGTRRGRQITKPLPFCNVDDKTGLQVTGPSTELGSHLRWAPPAARYVPRRKWQPSLAGRLRHCLFLIF
jgi:hypothetical protein